jgi:tRNA A-37 threonylcarbamoyl transferase component Bud32
MSDFIAAEDRAILAAHQLDNFDALWALELEAVDAPNTARGGYSSVARLQLGEHAYYLKRQSNYLTRSLRHPFGEPTFAREMRNIQRYQQLGIPALQAAFFAQRKIAGKRCAILLTRALDGWQDLEHWLQRWDEHPPAQRLAILQACGQLARRLHDAKQVHGCFYPKHIFLREEASGFSAQLIDLEKTRSLWFGQRDRIKDLEPLLRRAGNWSEDEVSQLLLAYVATAGDVPGWRQRLDARQQNKQERQ